MKILVIGASQFVSCFRKMGIEVLALVGQDDPKEHENDIPCRFFSGRNGFESQIRGYIESFRPDLIFQGDNSGPLIHTGLERFEIPRVWYAIDSHLHMMWHKHYAVLFDKVFCAQQNLISELSTYQPSVGKWASALLQQECSICTLG